MIRHIIAAITILLAAWAVWFMAQQDRKAERFTHIQQLIQKTQMEKVHVANTVTPISKPEPTAAQTKRKKEEDEASKKLKALRERAGNVMAFKVSPLYKQKCSSCHGVNGEGIIGPKLIGKSEAEVYQDLVDFKSGKRKNYVMYGLLSKMNDQQLKELSHEISTFAEKLKAAGN
ncbi:c-type cytochrome [Nitratifractor sp.]|uniref:c-type cytochrome n=1 Tax=Nitratifractor sp. TaxID=2268144 RepID=UPI0025EF9887|nr:c-type cytochrome [Nitratifractor sp.]